MPPHSTPTPQQVAAFEASVRNTVFHRQSVLLADDLFLVAVDYRPGRGYGSLVVEPSVLGFGLAGALICEMMLDRALCLDGDIVVAYQGRDAADPLRQRVQAMVLSERPRPIGEWVCWLGQIAVECVAKRMLTIPQARPDTDFVPPLLAKIEKKAWSGSRYHVTDYPLASWRAHRLAKMLVDRAATTWADHLLLGLMQAVGLTGHVLRMTEQDVSPSLASVEASLATVPAFTAVLAAVKEAVDLRGLSGRN
jgi:hypothetical protein